MNSAQNLTNVVRMDSVNAVRVLKEILIQDSVFLFRHVERIKTVLIVRIV